MKTKFNRELFRATSRPITIEEEWLLFQMDCETPPDIREKILNQLDGDEVYLPIPENVEELVHEINEKIRLEVEAELEGR